VTRAEALRRIGELHTAWSLQYGDVVPYVAADENPHDGQTTDLSVWQADRSASPDIDDLLNEEIKAILAQIDGVAEPATVAAADPALVAHMPGKHDQASHGKGGRGVRQSLQDAKTTEEVSAAIAAEASTITGRTIRVDMTGSDVQIAREHGEGILQGFERFPETPISTVHTYGPGSARPDLTDPFAFAVTQFGTQDAIAFNVGYARNPGRYQQDLTGSADDGWLSVPSPTGVALHEFGHSVSWHSGAATTPASRIVRPAAQVAGVKPSVLVRDQISGYAATDKLELSAEAFADVMTRGEDASPLSQEIFGLIESRYQQTLGGGL
jgi:hypothetical protein